MTATFVDWLKLREPADAAARSVELVEEVRRRLPAQGPLVIHDWDEDLLALAVADPPAGVTVEARRSDITRLPPLDDASLVVASALLDMLTADELAGMLAACAGRLTLIAMTVTGRVTFAPEDPLDAPLGAAFNDHQRRGGRLGPDAVAAVGGEVIVRPSPWRLDAAHAELFGAWFGGWVDAACELEPALAADGREYRERRLAQFAAGELTATVDHADLLVLP